MKDPCDCESLVEFQQATMSSMEQLTQKHILLLKSSFKHREINIVMVNENESLIFLFR